MRFEIRVVVLQCCLMHSATKAEAAGTRQPRAAPRRTFRIHNTYGICTPDSVVLVHFNSMLQCLPLGIATTQVTTTLHSPLNRERRLCWMGCSLPTTPQTENDDYKMFSLLKRRSVFVSGTAYRILRAMEQVITSARKERPC
jgi:hypothetical protein